MRTSPTTRNTRFSHGICPACYRNEVETQFDGTKRESTHPVRVHRSFRLHDKEDIEDTAWRFSAVWPSNVRQPLIAI